MSVHTEFDLGSLIWVKGEIDQALDRARQCLVKFGESRDAAELRFCQTHLHQVRGAIEMVGLEGAARFAEELEVAIGAAERGEADVAITSSAIQEGAIQLGQFLDSLVNGAPNQALKLLASYKRVRKARGETASGADLFFPDLAGQLPAGLSQIKLADAELAVFLKNARGRFEAGLLKWLKGSAQEGSQWMAQALLGAARTQSGTLQRGFWWSASAMCEGLADNKTELDLELRQLLTRLNLQLRRLSEGSGKVAERLFRDVLYIVSCMGTRSPHCAGVRRAFELDALKPARGLDEDAQQLAQRQLARELKELVNQAKENWARASSGVNDRLPLLKDQLNDLGRRGGALALLGFDGLVQAVLQALQQAGAQQDESTALEVATALLLLENALTVFPERSVEFPEQSAAMVRRLREGASAAPEVSLLDDVSRRAQERLLLSQVAQEIQANLRQIEQVLDNYFREPETRGELASLDSPIRQIRGALSMLDEQAARQLIDASAIVIEKCQQSDYQPPVAELEFLAEVLSSLGFYIEALQREDLHRSEVIRPALRKLMGEAAADAMLEPEQLTSESEAEAALESEVELIEPVPQAVVVETHEVEPPQEVPEPIDLAPAPVPQTAEEEAVRDEAVDAELLEVYLEEAVEVLATVAEHLQVLREQSANRDAMTVVRRSFHTLKGSGRMVGLNQLGEVAWAVEQVLNKWLQDEKRVSPGLLLLIEQVHQRFVAWVDQLKQTGAAKVEASKLFELAEQLKNGQEPLLEAAAEAVVVEVSEPEAAAEAMVDEVAESDLVEEAEPADLQIGDTVISRALFGIFLDEAHRHYATLSHAFADFSEDGSVRREDVHAAHTLCGIANTTGFHGLGELGHALEQALLAFDKSGRSPAADEREVLSLSIDRIGSMLGEIAHYQAPAAESNVVAMLHLMAERLRALLEAAGDEEEEFDPNIFPEASPSMPVEQQQTMAQAADELLPAETYATLDGNAAQESSTEPLEAGASDLDLALDLDLAQIPTLQLSAELAEAAETSDALLLDVEPVEPSANIEVIAEAVQLQDADHSISLDLALDLDLAQQTGQHLGGAQDEETLLLPVEGDAAPTLGEVHEQQNLSAEPLDSIELIETQQTMLVDDADHLDLALDLDLADQPVEEESVEQDSSRSIAESATLDVADGAADELELTSAASDEELLPEAVSEQAVSDTPAELDLELCELPASVIDVIADVVDSEAPFTVEMDASVDGLSTQPDQIEAVLLEPETLVAAVEAPIGDVLQFDAEEAAESASSAEQSMTSTEDVTEASIELPVELAEATEELSETVFAADDLSLDLTEPNQTGESISVEEMPLSPVISATEPSDDATTADRYMAGLAGLSLDLTEADAASESSSALLHEVVMADEPPVLLEALSEAEVIAPSTEDELAQPMAAEQTVELGDAEQVDEPELDLLESSDFAADDLLLSADHETALASEEQVDQSDVDEALIEQAEIVLLDKSLAIESPVLEVQPELAAEPLLLIDEEAEAVELAAPIEAERVVEFGLDDNLHLAESRDGSAAAELPATEASIESAAASLLQTDGIGPVAPLLSLDARLAEITVQDELDEQLLPIFIEEAQELMPQISAALRQLRELAHADAVEALKRLLHTLKGSARMAGAMRLGEATHNMETRLLNAGELLGHAVCDELEADFDLISELRDRLENPDKAVAAEAEVASTASNASVATVDAVMPVQIQAAANRAAPAQPLGLVDPEAGRSTIRVRADLLDRLVNQAGEVAIARSRIEAEMQALKRSLFDLTDNVGRLRAQLREIEIQAESQMQSRLSMVHELPDFDPLEFDRFSRLQELTRFMAESVNDVATIQHNLLKNLDESSSALTQQGRMTKELQQSLMRVRMVPFSSVSERLYRLVRQTGKETGKKVNLELRGGRVEIDRSVLEKMVSPFEHMLRNAIDHGLEKPDARQRSGKPDFGEVVVEARQEGNELVLTLRDDGAGLDLERIRQKALDQGLIDRNEQYSDQHLMMLIFEAGFSTASSVTQLSGRGIGMDVVKTEIEDLGGRIEVNSEPGRGTSFTIHLPLTLAVTQAVMVRVGEKNYAIPSVMVEQVQELKLDALEKLYQTRQVEWMGNQYPFHYLPRLLGDNETQAEHKRYNTVVLLRSGIQRIAIHVDGLTKNQEVVVKNIGPQLVRVAGVAGATVLGNGEIVLILNPLALAQRRSEAPVADFDAAISAAHPTAAELLQTAPVVMVVDDSLTVRKITGRLLAREGYQVETAKDGVDALQQLQDVRPAVMLLDVEMPRMDGFELTRNIRANAGLRDIPIIMITSRTADKHRNYALELGVNVFLGKPYQEEELLENIRRLIGETVAAE